MVQKLHLWLQSVQAVCYQPDPLPLSMGVPQRSILGPALFKIYINNIVHASGSSHINLYADDTILYTSRATMNSALTSLQHIFNSLQHAFTNLNLLLNTNKTKFMIVNRNLSQTVCHLNISSLDVTALQLVSFYKYSI